MFSSLKPITMYGQGGVNPPKVTMMLEELGLSYEFSPISMGQVKSPEYIAINPNGRLPAIHDPNTDLTLWESSAILEYLIEVYDKDHKFSFEAGSKEAFHVKQWLFFQASGQGPYYGQASWFTRFHPEQIASAKERYYKEVNRVTQVLENVLGQQEEKYPGTDGPWLVGNKFTYADLSFVPWQKIIVMIVPVEAYDVGNFPLVKAWIEKMLAREKVGKAFAASMAFMAAERAAQAAENEKAH